MIRKKASNRFFAALWKLTSEVSVYPPGSLAIRRRREYTPAALWILCCLIGWATANCSSQTRYNVLSTVFDGVPPPISAVSDYADSLSVRASRDWELEQITTYAHGPFAAKECGACHNLPETKSFRNGMNKSYAVPSYSSSANKMGRLLRPEEELCSYCHYEKSADNPDNNDKFLHGPVAAGECIVCHHPHQSPRPFMLLKSPDWELCSSCHGDENEKSFKHMNADAGSGSAGTANNKCIECHDPHSSSRQYMLKKSADITKSSATGESSI